MSLTKPRAEFKPFLKPKAYDYYRIQNSVHWSADEVSFAKDISDWNEELTESERQVVGQILKSFTQTETVVNEYWGQKVARWFPIAEIQMMASAFSMFESIHMEAYSRLNDELGLDDYSAFLEDETAVAKLDRLKAVKGNSKSDIARSLAIFSAFTEGVQLYSSFSILIGLSRFNMLKSMKNIIEWSVRDESLHSQAGCWLFREFIAENPEIWTDELKKDIYEAARIAVELEDNFIDKAFSHGSLRGLDPRDLKNFIRHRANMKLQELGLNTNWRNIDQESLKRMDWFDELVAGTEFSDFFSSRSTAYAKSNFNEDNLFEDK